LQQDGQHKGKDGLTDDDDEDELDDVNHRDPEIAIGDIGKLLEQELIVMEADKLRRGEADINPKKAQADPL
jgi:hypothetical protein